MKRSKKKHLTQSNSNPALTYYKEYGLANLAILAGLLVYTFIR